MPHNRMQTRPSVGTQMLEAGNFGDLGYWSFFLTLVALHWG